MPKRIAIVLFNLGGPDGPEAVRPFLFNLFNDKAIIGAPQPIRYLVARLISTTRAPSSRALYGEMGGGSPLLPWTQKQAAALDAALGDLEDGVEYKSFIAMRYWRPFTDDCVTEVKAWAPDQVRLLPLYPQFSTTTTGSSLAEWRKKAARLGLSAPTKTVCCYPEAEDFIAAHAELLLEDIRQAGTGPFRLLFSAHGLPEQVVKRGDPYQQQVETTVDAVIAKLAAAGRPDLDYAVCYQSRVGPLKWIGPSTDDEIKRAAADGVGIILTPIAFVSEHIETLVELDREYRELADECGVSVYRRTPALGLNTHFIQSLAKLIRGMASQEESVESACGGRLCPADRKQCPARLKAS